MNDDGTDSDTRALRTLCISGESDATSSKDRRQYRPRGSCRCVSGPMSERGVLK